MECPKPKALAKAKAPKPPSAVLKKPDWAKAVEDINIAQGLMPKVKGSRIELIEPKRAYTAFYPNVLLASRTRTWGFKFSRTKVLQHCIRWAWAEHKKQHPECVVPIAFV